MSGGQQQALGCLLSADQTTTTEVLEASCNESNALNELHGEPRRIAAVYKGADLCRGSAVARLPPAACAVSGIGHHPPCFWLSLGGCPLLFQPSSPSDPAHFACALWYEEEEGQICVSRLSGGQMVTIGPTTL